MILKNCGIKVNEECYNRFNYTFTTQFANYKYFTININIHNGTKNN